MDINFYDIWLVVDDSGGVNPAPPPNGRILQENIDLLLQEDNTLLLLE